MVIMSVSMEGEPENDTGCGLAPRPVSGSPSPQLSPIASMPNSQTNSFQRRGATRDPNKRQNTVSQVMLAGVPIVCLFIDAKERLCLAQISNTLLKAYSYNEIHNRRVALGITCVQCTPVQLEILRRAGAMPISSRRCGMITKREAERLVKSFLEDSAPPKLPENFAFDVSHNCGWGCRGNFTPSRYNSSRAKCIKCAYCNMFFSPNKFIFHFHRTPESTYNHPDAANFNSWRRHLKLTESSPPDELVHAWEDVKAMFNGGSRKRVVSSHSQGGSTHSRSTPVSGGSLQDPSKRPKLADHNDPATLPTRPHITSGHPPYHYPVFPVPNKMMPMKALQGHPAFGMAYGLEKNMAVDGDSGKPGQVPGWSNLHETLYPPYEMIWAKHLGLSGSDSGMPPLHFPKHSPTSPKARTNFVTNTSGSSFSPNNEYYGHEGQGQSQGHRSALRRSDFDHLSAFRPVGSHCASPGPPELRSPYSPGTVSPRAPGELPEENDRHLEDEDSSGDENVDVDTIDDEPMEELCPEQNNNVQNKNEEEEQQLEQDRSPNQSPLPQHDTVIKPASSVDLSSADHPRRDSGCVSPADVKSESAGSNEDQQAGEENRPETELGPKTEQSYEEECDKASKHDDYTDHHTDSEQDEEPQLESLSKDQLQRELQLETKARRKMEEDCRTIKETFQQQVEREKQYRDEMAKQLQIVRETLCHELDQERKVRFSLQQKLKEAHDALHNFSCKMLASRQCAECSYEKTLMPR